LDDSIGCAVWFAARGRGSKRSSTHPNTSVDHYSSPARVVILGMGADEQLAGYVRHRRLYDATVDSLAKINDELSTEVSRIGVRNLGRDNRVVADHGREARYPFLDEDVHSFVNSLPLHLKLVPELPLGFGGKIVLRYLASELLLLKKTAWEPKRAIQFGSRIAKLENSKENGGDVCDRL
jgi:asparagine synthetase B (glutamine-hydrolysing)